MHSWQYIALLGAVIVIAALLMPKNKSQQNNASSAAQMEQLELAFEQFMENMEKEHEELVQMLTSSLQKLREEDRLKSEQLSRLESSQRQAEEQLARLAQQNAALEAKLQIVSELNAVAEKLTLSSSAPQTGHQAAYYVETQEQLKQEVHQENSIQSRYAELFELYNAGKSVEAIAKKLGKNKGEVQLIIQLAMQEGNAHHA